MALSLIHSTPPPTPPSVPAPSKELPTGPSVAWLARREGMLRVEAEGAGTLYTYQTARRLYRSVEYGCGSYRQLSEFGLRKSDCPRRHERELRGEETRVESANEGQASSKQTQATV
jgi:hypothetical protein